MTHPHQTKDQSRQRQSALSAMELARRESNRASLSSHPETFRESPRQTDELQPQGDQSWLSLISALSAQPNLQQRPLSSTTHLPLPTSNGHQSNQPYLLIPPGLDFSQIPFSPSNSPLFPDHSSLAQQRTQEDSYSIADMQKTHSYDSEHFNRSNTNSEPVQGPDQSHPLYQFFTQQFKTPDSSSVPLSIPPISIPSASPSSYAFPPPEPFFRSDSVDRRISLPLSSSSSSLKRRSFSPSERTPGLASPSITPVSDSKSTPGTQPSGRSESGDRSKPTSPIISPKPKLRTIAKTSSTRPKSKSISAGSIDEENYTITAEDEEDKRRRNTEASARFRAKKKAKVRDLSVSVSTLETSVRDLELEAGELRRENGWLKEIVLLKRNGTQPMGETAKAGDTS
ncbi:Basic-leucine zipper domain [Phaffia rhodozyma]|uniref:Basic-leucine zipper domain n=1 Tax=Phaffia rhodozyma TaxID=264483 RepID=A0A0F7SJF5_PHARH|nr:Basic-leucine zipper domain [Phaffia rhodozyma]